MLAESTIRRELAKLNRLDEMVGFTEGEYSKIHMARQALGWVLGLYASPLRCLSVDIAIITKEGEEAKP